MIDGVDKAVQAMTLREIQMDSIAHNLANATSAGFKQERLSFEQVLDGNPQQDLDKNPGTETLQLKSAWDFSPGAAMPTNNPLDLAVQGEGFFAVEKGGETLYTRNGAFTLDANGFLVTAQGHRVLGPNGTIQIDDSGPIQINNSGKILVSGEEQGQVGVFKVADKKQLTSAGAQLFKLEGGDAEVDSSSTVLQGSLESSNTNTVLSLVEMMEVSRQYMAYQKILQLQNKLDQESAPSLGKIT